MKQTFDVILKTSNALATDVDGRIRQSTDLEIGIVNGKISAISAQSLGTNSPTILDCRKLTVLPGIIDPQVHFREPGLEHKEDLESGTLGAVLGGVTGVYEMPNTKPSTTSATAFDDKLERAKNRVWSHISFYIGACPENIGDLARLESHPNCPGIKVFMGSSTGNLLIPTDELLEKVLRHGHRRVIVHSEDEHRLKERRSLAQGHPRNHPVWRDELTALNATDRLLKLARQTLRPVHVLHVSTAEEMELLSRNRDIATVEVLPQYLTLTAPECYERLGTLAQMNPPIRGVRHREALWRALDQGIVTMIGSDHAPHTLDEKRRPYPQSPSGMTGVQTLLPIMLNHVNQGRLSIERLCELSSANPAKVFGARAKGGIAIGKDADFTIVDMQKTWRISNSWIASRCGWTPFDGMQVQGWPTAVVLDGQKAVWEGQVIGSPLGRLIEFHG